MSQRSRCECFGGLEHVACCHVMSIAGWIPFRLMGVVLFASQSYKSDFDIFDLTLVLRPFRLIDLRPLLDVTSITSKSQVARMDTANNYVLPEFGLKDIQIAKERPSSFGGRVWFHHNRIVQLCLVFPNQTDRAEIEIEIDRLANCLDTCPPQFVYKNCLQLLQDVPTLKKGSTSHKSAPTIHGTCKAYN